MELVEELVHNRQDTLDMMLYSLPLMCVCKYSIILGQLFITRFNLRIAKSLDFHLLLLQLVFLLICYSSNRPSIPCMCTFLLSDQIEFIKEVRRYRAIYYCTTIPVISPSIIEIWRSIRSYPHFLCPGISYVELYCRIRV